MRRITFGLAAWCSAATEDRQWHINRKDVPGLDPNYTFADCIVSQALTTARKVL